MNFKINFKNLTSFCIKFLLLFFTIFIGTLHLAAQEKIISGVISDFDSVPLPGVNVIIKNSNIGTVSDFDGNYSISANTGDVLIFSFVGFENQEIIIGDQNNLDISMVADYANLDEIVLTGYGSTAKKDFLLFNTT